MDDNFNELITKLKDYNTLSDEELKILLDTSNSAGKLLAEAALCTKKAHYGNDIFIRGLIEFTNYCKNNCLYCGIRAANDRLERFRLSRTDILECCRTGYSLGFRTFVLQGGEDMYFTDDIMCDIINEIHTSYPDCVITLSIGEKSRESYKAYFDAGARRFLLRHETATDEHYKMLHPGSMSLSNRKQCLYNLKETGYQVGTGFMVGSPYQTVEHIIEDLRFIQKFNPHMVGIGPFISHKDTPFGAMPNGSTELTLRLLSIIRLMLPKVLLPATTALNTLDSDGHISGILSGANVIMPNLSPHKTRRLYNLYDGKCCTDCEAAENLALLERKVSSAGFRIVYSVGNPA